MDAKCGSCHGTHDTIDEYRICSGLMSDPAAVPASDAERAAAALDALMGTPHVDKPSNEQITYVLDLLAKHDWPDEIREAELRNMERRQVSRLIKDLQLRPLREGWLEKALAEGIPEGRYALKKAGEDGWSFWEIDRPTRGKWAGFTFVKMLIGAPGDYRVERVSKAVAQSVMDRIEEVTPARASMDFGQQSETCGICHSPLTNSESITAGIGPVCRSRMGW
jgi:hypothetical protein